MHRVSATVSQCIWWPLATEETCIFSSLWNLQKVCLIFLYLFLLFLLDLVEFIAAYSPEQLHWWSVVSWTPWNLLLLNMEPSWPLLTLVLLQLENLSSQMLFYCQMFNHYLFSIDFTLYVHYRAWTYNHWWSEKHGS